MRKLIAILVVALAIPTMSFADTVGQYKGVIPNSGGGIWIVDTMWGDVKFCNYERNPEPFKDPILICDPWSTDRKEYK